MSARIGVAGVGWWACLNHIPALLENPHARLVALADPSAERRDRAGDTFGIAGRYATVEDMLSAEELDGVVVASPHVAHFANASAALERGCHVLVEKPMTTSAAQARRLAEQAQTAGREVLVPCGWNFKPYTPLAARWVSEGRIGTVEHVACQMASALDDLFGGKPMIETETHMFRPPPSTWADPARAGGYGWGQMSHLLAWVYRVTGLAPEAAFCLAGRSPTGVDYYDAASVRLVGGATLAASGAATVPKGCGFQLDVRLFGSEGMIVFDIERERLDLHRRDGSRHSADLQPGDGDYEGQAPLHRFVDICRGLAAVNDADATVGARVVETLDAMYRSAASGTLEPVLGD